MAPSRAQTKFVVDAMLGSLSRKLRAFGFDVAYYKRGDDAGIMALSRRQRRILVTADRSLASRSERLGLPTLLVSGETDGERLSAMVADARQRGIALSRGEPRCSLCNAQLRKISAVEARSQVQPAVAQRHRSFYKCRICGQVYWRGGHWKKLRRLQRLFESAP